MTFSHYPADPYIRLQRGGCHATCPDYTLSVLGDGRLHFVGHAFVKYAGFREGRLSTHRLTSLLEAFRASHAFMSAPPSNRVPRPFRCTSSTVLFFRYRRTARKVVLLPARQGHEIANDATELEELAERIDVLTRSRQWVGSEEERLIPFAPTLARH